MKRFAAMMLALAATPVWAAEGYAPGAPKDPVVRTAQFEVASGRQLSALSELLAIPADAQAKLPASADYRWLLAESYLSFGMSGKAEGLYRDLARTPAVEIDRLAKARLRLADFYFQRGYENESRNVLTGLRDGLPQALLESWQEQTVRGLLAQKRYGEAIEILTRYNNTGRHTPYTRYNLGIALINNGKLPEGRAILDEVGDLSVETSADLALRDKANLTLGWHYLGQKMGPEARRAFVRVRSQGPYSNRALLGLGWSELLTLHQGQSPNSETASAVATGAESAGTSLAQIVRPGFLDNTVFSSLFGGEKARLGTVSPEEEDALRRALVPWVELINRNPMDPAVNESWLAIPYTLDRLGAHQQALRYYDQAVSRLEDARKRAETAMGSIRQGRMVETIIQRDPDAESGWTWELKDLPDAPETYYLQTLIAEHRFQEALKNYRDARLLSRTLEQWARRLDAMQSQATGQDRAAVEPEVLFKRIREGFIPPWPAPTIPLRMESELAPPGTYSDPLPAAPRSRMPLKLGVPKHIDMPWQQLQTLRGRLNVLQQSATTASAEQSRLVKNLALSELDGQKKQIEKYLVEARFALARLYDQQRKSGARE